MSVLAAEKRGVIPASSEPKPNEHSEKFNALDLPQVSESLSRQCDFEELSSVQDLRNRYLKGAKLVVEKDTPVQITYEKLMPDGNIVTGELINGDHSMKSVYQRSVGYLGIDRNQDGKDHYRLGLARDFCGIVTLNAGCQSFSVHSGGSGLIMQALSYRNEKKNA